MSLKIKILFLIGSVITVLMMTISVAFLYQFRSVVIQKEVENIRSITDAISIPFLDALVYSETDGINPDIILERHLSYLADKIDGIRFVHIYDSNDRLVIHSLFHSNTEDHTYYNPPPATRSFVPGRQILNISRQEGNGWIIEVESPLAIAGKKWGTAVLGFDGNPVRREIISISRILLYLGIAVTSITLLVLYFLINRLTMSLGRLTEAIDHFDLETPQTDLPLPESDDEIGYLSHRFELLQKRLIESRNHLAVTQRQIYRAEKLAFIGRLSAGIAHEVNNSVNGIQSCIYAIEKDPQNTEQTTSYLKLINEALKHIENIVKKLLEYSRKNNPSLSEVDLRETIQNVIQLCSYKIKEKKIDIDFKADKNLPVINADKHLMREVMMNLVINSIDAVDEEGRIRIRTGRKNKECIYLNVEDNGTGILPENQEFIFEPFFTTKETGKGTGLGLSAVLGIVEAHDGEVRVESKPGEKTIFTITLPISGRK